MEPWKRTICQSSECLKEVFDGRGRVKEYFYLYPDIDNEVMTQFTCPECGNVETWGITRKRVQKTLYERLRHA